MKSLALAILTFTLTGCSVLGTKDYANYVESSKSISKDSTVAQTACWSAVAEIAKNGDNAAKVNAISLAEKCKNETIKLAPPKQGLLNW